jgi:YesN/AraC family two-component response regulator
MYDEISKKVMIVDDSNLLQTRIKNKLLEVFKNITIEYASNCKDAIELFSRFDPDVVILDISLPDGSGIGLLQKFKEDNPMVKVNIFTNYPTQEFKKRCIDLRADHFIDKSDYLALINAVR